MQIGENRNSLRVPGFIKRIQKLNGLIKEVVGGHESTLIFSDDWKGENEDLQKGVFNCHMVLLDAGLETQRTATLGIEVGKFNPMTSTTEVVDPNSTRALLEIKERTSGITYRYVLNPDDRSIHSFTAYSNSAYLPNRNPEVIKAVGGELKEIDKHLKILSQLANESSRLRGLAQT